MNGLSISDLHFSYPQTPVLNGISLEIGEGERVGIVGPNGAGKTTLFHSVCGVLRPNSGAITLFDQPVIPGRFHPAIGLVFQYPDDQLFSPTVWDDVAFGPLNMGLPYDDVEKRVEDAVALTGIGDLIDRAPHHLSGGQKRMVAIAGIQAMKPRLIIYDEPSANLDMRSRRRLIRFIQASAEMILVASHDLELVLEVCERVILLDDGAVIADGTPIDIMSDDALMETHGLECPHSLRPHIHTQGEIDLHDHH
ncbi:MAG: energy-coupling factor ABC transporter ATP-binding protein [Anaerolineae bacterium]|nr:energy-coupling factor ABC transporter ATP-binding protein [Anaerolineae bacterium]MCO5204273.1 energy-coupling factor ABC transporter ATP-binding protein [Anaerolineae bacterium]